MKTVQKVWLLFLSSIFLLGALLTLIVSIDWNSNRCSVNGEDYEVGDTVGGYLENATCTCGEGGKVVCELKNVTKSFLDSSDFTTKNLDFDAEFSNSLSGSEVNIADEIVFRSVSQSKEGLKIIIEKLDLCSSDGDIQDQVGFYSLGDDVLVLTTIGTGDPEKYSSPCIVKNIFLLKKITGNVNDDLKVYYRDEDDSVYLADMCVYEGKLHNDGDTYMSSDECTICQCTAGENTCSSSCEN